MSKTWEYEAMLPGGMDHTIQVQPNTDDVDFNVIVLSASGEELAADRTDDPGARVTLSTIEETSAIVRVELVRGTAAFSLNVSSKTSRASALDDDTVGDVVGARDTGSAPLESELTSSEVAGLLNAHNRWRARYSAAPLEWSEKLSEVAQDWANQLGEAGMRMHHRSPNPFGENLYWCSGMQATPSDVVDAWGNEGRVLRRSEEQLVAQGRPLEPSRLACDDARWRWRRPSKRTRAMGVQLRPAWQLDG